MKIAIVGAGSFRFALQLIGDLAKTPSLNGSLIALMDINEERLNATYILAKRYMEELGSALKFEKTTNLEAALEGADFVINTALPFPEGHEDGFIKYDIVTQIGEKHGYYRGIDSQELNMVSTYTYVLISYYDLKLAIDIAKAMKKYAPSSWLLQTANPVFEITQLLNRLTDINVVGICHGFHGVYEVFNSLRLDPKEVDWQVAGVNHGIFLNRFLYRGKNAYPLLDEWIEKESQNWEPKNPWDLQMSPAAMDMYKFYGMLPIGDTCRNGTWKYHYNLETKKKWYGKFGGIDNEIERPKFHNQLREGKKRMLELAKEVEKDPHIKLIENWPELFSKDKFSGEQHIPFINAISGGDKVRLILNVKNNGVISGIRDDVIVEIPVWVDKTGIHPEKLEPDLTDRVKNFYLMPKILRMEWALEGFISKDIKVLEEILVRDPRTKSYEQVLAVLDEILTQPFNKELREYLNY
ncbi:alpha-glucosidase/alpha-galactosidase [Dictyoglomus thermophilum]|uniref:alpha-glucosidase AglA n=1 Tax=Dictyoglomus thermophilum TaxID=14 RepID=UPI0011EB5D52|nr:alpha-glucosidase AglA [Dictyoglomus thermophilum]TYT24361.1 alpha-glucosidase/alpha-galactosidase [Dictyoglomus thermophilum]